MERKRVMLGAYQYIDIEPYVDEQFGEGAVKAVLTTSMDEPFVNRSVTAILSRQYQDDLVAAFSSPDDLETAQHYDKARGLLDRAHALLIAEGSNSSVVYDIERFLGVDRG